MPDVKYDRGEQKPPGRALPSGLQDCPGVAPRHPEIMGTRCSQKGFTDPVSILQDWAN